MAGGFSLIERRPQDIGCVTSAAYRNTASGEVIPQRIIDKAPSAELRENQTDQDSLPPYPDLDDYACTAYVEDDMSSRAIMQQGYHPKDVMRVTQLIDRNEYKRSASASRCQNYTKRVWQRPTPPNYLQVNVSE